MAAPGSVGGLSGPPFSSKIPASVLLATEAGGTAPVIVLLGNLPDLSPAAALPTREAKGRFVWAALRRAADESQGPLLARLRGLGVPFRVFHGVNALAVAADRNLVLELAAREDVRKLEPDAPFLLSLPPREPSRLQPAAPVAPEPGIVQTRAPEVWAAGATGAGIVVAGQDTGIAWTHPALQGSYRGWNAGVANHDYSWHDAIHTSTGPCGSNSPFPCDDDGHGTHTLGTAVGLEGANQIGMAPGARWIGCRNMDGGAGTPSAYLECFEFFLAPYPVGGTPAQGDPARSPHVTNNSWACPGFEGCAVDTLRLAVLAQRAAGIFAAVSAGNSGPGCSTVADPPAIYGESWTVGSLQTGTTTIAGTSGRGPVTIDGSGRTKPDLAAPGTGIRSSVPGGGYAAKSGTSMAAPHVAGAVALLWSAQPALVGQVSQTERILADSAVPVGTTECGSTMEIRPNQVYGWGSLDVKAAVDLSRVRPILSGLSPATGPLEGGTAVTVLGANFATGAFPPVVTFGGVASPAVTVAGPGRLVAVSPPHGAGRVDVSVTNPGGAAGTLSTAFSFEDQLGRSFFPLQPCRAVDTRGPEGPLGGPALAAMGSRTLPLAGACAIPTDAVALSLNLTVVGPEAAGYLTLSPADAAAPGSSTLNFRAGQVKANGAIAPVGPNAGLGVSNSSAGASHILVDVNGFFR